MRMPVDVIAVEVMVKQQRLASVTEQPIHKGWTGQGMDRTCRRSIAIHPDAWIIFDMKYSSSGCC